MSENSKLAQAILSQLAYITLSTATQDGVPWNAPVYAAFDETYTFFWVSAKYARHSQNIRANPRIAIVVYDSTVPPGTGKGVYIEARAYELTDSVPGHSCWPQNGPFDANLAHLLSCNTASLCKNTTHKTPQSAGRFVIWLSANKRHFLFRHLVMIGVTTDTFCVDFWRFLLRSHTIPAKQRVHRLSSSFQDGFAGQERDHLPDQIFHTLLQRAGKRREASHHSVRHAVHGP